MDSQPAGAWLSTIAAPLSSKFGPSLSLNRSGNTVCWGFEGQSAVIELNGNGSLRATFIGVECTDVVSSRPAAAVYRASTTYSLNPGSCRRMVADMVDFFSGVREPKFTFIDAFPR